MRCIRIVDLEAEGRKSRIADDDLEVLVDVVKTVDLRAQMPIETGVLPAQFIVRQLLGTECRGSTQAHRDIQTTGPEARGDEAVEEIILIEGVVQRDLAGGVHVFLRLVISQRQSVLHDLDVVGGLGSRVARSDLQLKSLCKLKTQLTEAGERRHRVGTLKRVLGCRTSRRLPDYELIRGKEIISVPVRIASEYPGHESLVGRNDVE